MSKVNLKTTAEYQALDQAHHLHPFTEHHSMYEEGARIIVRAQGSHIYDNEGAKIIDGMGGLWCVNVGYGCKEINDAIAAQLQDLAYYNTFFKTSTPAPIELAHEISSVTPEGLNHVFFGLSGSDGNDTVLRMVRHYWAAKGQPQRKKVISRHNAYHGSTMAGGSLGGMSGIHSQGGLPIPDIHHIRQPYWYGEGGDMQPDEFGLACARALEEEILKLGQDQVAAFIGEPIQGAGGVIVPPETYWPEVERICRKYGILLVSDEVICGFGRTGSWFGCQTFGFTPDIMTTAKGLSSGYLPIGAVIVNEEVSRVIINDGGEFYHGYTYSGHPVCCAAALANLRVIKRDKLVERVASDIGPYMQKRWHSLADHPMVGETRMVGLMGALELTPNKATRARFEDEGKVGTICRDFCFKNNLIMRAVYDRMVTSPPLVITHEEVDELVEKALLSIDQTYEEVKKLGLMK